jgi:uncharacterized protein YoxC
MAAEMNDLLEEGVTRCGALTDAADEALDAIDEMAKEAEGLAQRVEEEGKEACEHLRDLAGRLEGAEDALGTGRARAESALEDLTAEASGLQAEAGQLLERVKKSLAEVESRQEELDGAIDAHMGSTQQDFQELVQKTQEAESKAEEELQEAAQRVAALRAAIEESRASFAGKQQAWDDAVHELETAVQEKAQEWVDGLNALLRRQSEALLAAANEMVDQHNAAMDGLRHRFVEQAPQDLAESLDRVEAALATLGGEAAACGQRLSTDAEQLEQWAAAARPPLTPIQAALDSAAGLG